MLKPLPVLSAPRSCIELMRARSSNNPAIKRLLLQLIWKHVDPAYPANWIEVRRIGEKRPAD